MQKCDYINVFLQWTQASKAHSAAWKALFLQSRMFSYNNKTKRPQQLLTTSLAIKKGLRALILVQRRPHSTTRTKVGLPHGHHTKKTTKNQRAKFTRRKASYRSARMTLACAQKIRSKQAYKNKTLVFIRRGYISHSDKLARTGHRKHSKNHRNSGSKLISWRSK